MEPFCVAEINVRSSTNSPQPTKYYFQQLLFYQSPPGYISDCYEENPDIAGVGVRLSIYIQALLSFAPAILASVDGQEGTPSHHLCTTSF